MRTVEYNELSSYEVHNFSLNWRPYYSLLVNRRVLQFGLRNSLPF